MTVVARTCSVCGQPMWQKHAETCTGGQPVVEVARTIVSGGVFTDRDAVRVADAYLWLLDDGAKP